MRKYILIFYLNFIFLIFLSNLGYAEYITVPINKNERLLKVYYWENLVYILSKYNNYLRLRIYENNILVNNFSKNFDGEIIDVKFIEIGDALLIVVLNKNLNDFKIIFLNNSLDINQEINLSRLVEYQFINWEYLDSQGSIILIFKNLDLLKIFKFDLNNNLSSETTFNIHPKEKFIKLINNNFDILLITKDESNYFYKLYLLDSLLNLIYSTSLDSNFRFSEVSNIGGIYYLCGLNSDNNFYLITFNSYNLSLGYELERNIKIDDRISCKYIEGDINDLLLIYYYNNNLQIKFLNYFPNNLLFNLRLNNYFDIREIKVSEPEVFGGNINLILDNRYRSIFFKINIFHNEILVNKYFTNFNYLDNYFDNLADKIVILFQGINRNLGLIYSEF
ncbi:MAG: hypothetical protein KatS3mg094_170 [Candidatus Parcubacteria bacterium]|nr:MAG: hypothetical protein KatS3mg094_170 [Candidatus Parcubacteria bacterium]